MKFFCSGAPGGLFVWLEMPNTIGSPLFEISCVFVRLNHVARRIVNANHSVVSAAARESHARVE
jgi:hypothetical protein